MSIFLILLLLFLFVPMTVIISFIARIMSFFGSGKRREYNNRRDSTGPGRADTHRKPSNTGKKKRIFENDEGEYVDFEEIK